MICQRCGYCCIACSVVVVVGNRLKNKMAGTLCPNLYVASDGTTTCKVHDEPWYKNTPCFVHGNPDIDPDYAANPKKLCAIGVCYRTQRPPKAVLTNVTTTWALEDIGSAEEIMKDQNTTGDVTMLERSVRFLEHLGDKVLKNSPFKSGDWAEVTDVSICQSDSSAVVKLHVVFKNKRTGDEYILTLVRPVFNPNDSDDENIDSLSHYLQEFMDTEESTSEAYKLLKKAKLISDRKGK